MASEIALTAATIFLAWFFLPSPSPVTSHQIEDVDALVAFASRTPHRRPLNWSLLTPVCHSWIGVTCNDNGSRVISLHLPSFDFHGEIPPGTLGRLSALETLSLPSNSLAGAIPSDLLRLTSLVEVHLQFNRFSGPLPANFSPSKSNLAVLDLSFNSFNGSIPPSISNLANLVSLNLSNNSLDGKIPDLEIASLRFLNLSNNRLEGTIPPSLKGFPPSSFEGNPIYSNSSWSVAVARSPAARGGGRGNGGLGKKMSEPVLLGIVIGGIAVGLMVVVVLLVFLRKGRKEVGSGKMAKWERSPKNTAISKEERNHLVFFEGCSFAFDLEDLLRASAEVLGKGMFGTAYKATMEDSVAVVVKRLKDVSVGKREFEQQMEMVGRLRHENVVELRAYYYSKDEKLMVYDYCSQGSVFSMLHGKRGDHREPLSWEGRLKIAVGAARGLAYIHAENGGKLVHGNIKSTNIFLNSSLYGCISDLGVTTLVNLRVPPVSRTAGYRAPEVVDGCKATQMSDVYSFGVVLLELLTGKSPMQVIGGGDEVVHLVRWVQSVVREEWTGEVFDVELMRFPNIEEEMVEMLQIAMSCVVRMPEQRPKILDVLKLVEDVRRLDTDDRPSFGAKSEDSSGLV